MDGAVLLNGDLHARLSSDPLWYPYLAPLSPTYSPYGVHLAVFVEPYLGYVLDGTKTVESRFSQRSIPPYRVVSPGDVILLKQSGGPVVGVCRIADAWFYELNPSSWRDVRGFAKALRVEGETFWDARADASYATLMRIEHPRTVAPLGCVKRDRRGWVVLHRPTDQAQLPW